MIKVTHLSKKFGELEVLKDINCEIEKGEVISIIGPSGTGKSTLLRCLNLLEVPDSGSIEIDGEDILAKGANAPKLRQKMGMVFQSFNLFAHLSVLENLTIGPVKLLGKSKEEAGENACELLKKVGLSEKVDSFPDELSGGQKQRVAIARGLAMDPEIMLFDEPTSALDPTMVSEVLGVVRRLAKDGMTMAIVTHEMEFARNVSSRIFYMDEGLIYEDGPSQEIFNNPKKEKTKIFINRIRKFEYEIKNKDFDFYGMNGEIKQFCEKYLLPKIVHNTMLLTEELIFLFEPPLTLMLDYSEISDKIMLTLRSSGELINPLTARSKADDISRAIINNLAKNIEEQRLAEQNLLTMEVKMIPHNSRTYL
ncbi:amino acid ABC transporter ATP-binding protein [Candidatus Contubernalis alkaliaceticus]|uniref:amino acid ABC transporter ATP-binding protein n=1 Tax=Candidatus Contubernalis alkaliaceticus TaxID=338645 RepID=UPI0024091F7A|nr:amino acid ABC transporter ATP-binding protein [Candidatus Contubernalis alkalaceticus]UNC92453.1 amino acid ABC transporter ATP-binding protein [Candidatus Contubernalis alkalaceticus]